MNVMCDGQATGKKGHGNTLAWPQLLVKPEQHAGLSQGGRQGLGTAQGNGVGIALGKSDRHLHHHPSPPHYHLSSKGYSQEAPNHWALVWDVGTQAGAAAAAAAAAAARGRLGQWARLRREARGGGILLPQEMEALGRQYSCLEHEFQGFKRKWPELDAEAANRRALRRAYSAQRLPASSHLVNAQTATGGRAPSRGQRAPSRPRTAPSVQQTHAASRSASTSRGQSNCSKLPARGAARTPERKAQSPLPSPSAAQLQQQRAPSRNRNVLNPPHHAHPHPVQQQQQQHPRLPASCASNTRTPERSRPPFSTHIALNHAQPPTAHRPSTPSNKYRTPERSRPPSQASKLCERAGTGEEALAQLTPLRTQQREQGSTPHRKPGDVAATTAAVARAQHTGTPQAGAQQQGCARTSSPAAFAWELEGGTPAFSPFGHPLLVGDMGSDFDDDDEDPFSMPNFGGGASRAPPGGRNSDSSAIMHRPLMHPPDSAGNGCTPGHRHVRQSSELLLPSLGSLSAMLAATSNPNTPRDNTQQHHHKTHSTPLQLQPQQQQQQQQPHTQHARLMQRRLLQEQRRREMLLQQQQEQQQQHGHAPHTSATTAPAAAPHTLTVRNPSAAFPHASTFHLQQHSPTSPSTATALPNGSAHGVLEPTRSPPPQGRLVSHNGGSSSSGSKAAAGLTTPSPKLPVTSNSSGGKAGGEERPMGGSSRARVLAMAAALSGASSPAAHCHASPPHTSAAASSPSQLASARKGVGNGAAAGAAAAGVRGASYQHHIEGAGEGRKRTAPASTAAAPAAVDGGQHPTQARKAGGWTPGKSSSSSGSSNGGTGRALQASSRTRTDTTNNNRSKSITPLAPKSNAKASVRHTPHSPALPSSRVAIPRTPTAPPSTFSAAAAAAAANPSSATTPPSANSKPAIKGSVTSTSMQQRQHTPVHTQTSVGHLSTHPPSHLTRPLHPSIASDPAAAALAAAAASLSTARSRSGLSSPVSHRTASTAGSLGSAAGSSTHNSPRPSFSGAPSPHQTPLPPRPRTRVQRGGATSTSPTTPFANDTSPHLQQQPLGSPFFCTPASHTTSAFGRENDAASRHNSGSSNINNTLRKRSSSTGGGGGGRRRSSSSGTSPGGQQYLQRLQRDARARHAAAAVPSPDPPALLASPLSPSPSMRTARSSDTSAHTTPELTTNNPSALHPQSAHQHQHPLPHTSTFSPPLDVTHSSSSSSSSSGGKDVHTCHTHSPSVRMQQHLARRLTAPLMRSLPSHIPSPPGVRGSDGDLGIERWSSPTDGPPSPHLALHDHEEEELLPLMQLSALRSMRQSRMSAASSASSMAAGGGATSQTTPTNAFASPAPHSPSRKSRASDSSAMQQRHQNHHHRHSSVTFLLPPTPSSSEAAPPPSSSQDKPLTSAASPHSTQRPAFRLSNSNPLCHSAGVRQRSLLPSSPLPSTSATLAGSPPAGGASGGGGSGRLGGAVRGSRSGGGTRMSPPPACTPRPFQALQSKSFTAGGVHSSSLVAARQAAMAAAAGVHSHHPCNAGQLQRQPTGRSLFDSGSCAVLDEDADVELVSRGGSGSSHHSGASNSWALDTAAEGISRNTKAPEARGPTKQSDSGSQAAHPTLQQQQQQQQQQQRSTGVHAPATTATTSNANNNNNTTSSAKGVGGGLSSYWSRLFSRAPAQHPSPPQPHPASRVGETA